VNLRRPFGSFRQNAARICHVVGGFDFDVAACCPYIPYKLSIWCVYQCRMVVIMSCNQPVCFLDPLLHLLTVPKDKTSQSACMLVSLVSTHCSACTVTRTVHECTVYMV
jgi:hypothetical protein